MEERLLVRGDPGGILASAGGLIVVCEEGAVKSWFGGVAEGRFGTPRPKANPDLNLRGGDGPWLFRSGLGSRSHQEA